MTGDAAAADVLLVAMSSRALADSALRAGFRPSTVDWFGDLDQKSRVANVALGRDLGLPYSAAAAARCAARLSARAVAYGADLENHPAAVARLARGRELLGNPPAVLRAVRDPERVFAALGAAGVPTPRTLARRPAGGLPPGARWLRKPRAGGGGVGVALASGAASRPRRAEVLQELLEGPSFSLAFLADGARALPLALSLQLEEREAFGAAPFAYCGSVSRLPEDIDTGSVREQAWRAAQAVTRAFGLRGWNGMDFLLRRGEVVPLEVNPRHTSSMELWDEPRRPLFADHVRACRGSLEGDWPADGWLRAHAGTRGKAILFARVSVRVGDSARWLELRGLRPAAASRARRPRGGAVASWPESAVADLPHPGERIPAGRPVCTLFAAAPTAPLCVAALRQLAATVERDLEPEAATTPLS
ncbi:MAG: ATP-grasp domain-containing protein [Gemmatimonadota bacterium]